MAEKLTFEEIKRKCRKDKEWCKKFIAWRLLHILLPEEATKLLPRIIREPFPDIPPLPPLEPPPNGPLPPPTVPPFGPGPPRPPAQPPPAAEEFPTSDVTLEYVPDCITYLDPNFYLWTDDYIPLYYFVKTNKLFETDQNIEVDEVATDICQNGTNFFTIVGITVYKYDLNFNVVASTELIDSIELEGIATDGNRLYIFEPQMSAVHRLDFDLNYLALLDGPDQAHGATYYDGYYYVCATVDQRIRKLNTSFTQVDQSPGLGFDPIGIEFAGPAFWILEMDSTTVHRKTMTDLGF